MSDIADLGMLCRALGFLAVAMKEENLKAGSGKRAEKLAQLIEQFCRISEDEAGAADAPAVGGGWQCEERDGKTFIRTTGATRQQSDNVIELRGADEQTTRAVAEHIVRAVNDNSRKDALIAEMSACLEMCMESSKLGWDAEHDADILVERAKGIRG